MTDNILTFGITDLDVYPDCKYTVCCKEFLENDTLCIPEKKPDIDEINSIHVNVYIKDFKIIKTIQGYKLIIEATKSFKVMYIANTCYQSVHAAHWDRNFCQFILLPDNCNCSCINDIFIGIEDIIVKCYNDRIIDVSTLLIACPTINSNVAPKTFDKCNYFSKNNDSSRCYSSYKH